MLNNMLNKYDEPNESNEPKQSASDSNNEHEEKNITDTSITSDKANESTITHNARVTENALNSLNIRLNNRNQCQARNNKTYVKRKDLKKYIHLDKTGHVVFQGFSPKIQRNIRVYPEIYAIFSTLSHGELMRNMNEALIDYLKKQDIITADTAAKMHEANV